MCQVSYDSAIKIRLYFRRNLRTLCRLWFARHQLCCAHWRDEHFVRFWGGRCQWPDVRLGWCRMRGWWVQSWRGARDNLVTSDTTFSKAETALNGLAAVAKLSTFKSREWKCADLLYWCTWVTVSLHFTQTLHLSHRRQVTSGKD